jgi:hypothetical protein
MRTKFTIEGDIVAIRYPDGKTLKYMAIGRDRGYVYDVTKKPGTLGQQVMDPRGPRGTTLMGPRDGMALAALLRDRLQLLRKQYIQREFDPADARL